MNIYIKAKMFLLAYPLQGHTRKITSNKTKQYDFLTIAIRKSQNKKDNNSLVIRTVQLCAKGVVNK